MTESVKSFFRMTIGQMTCIPVLIGWPIVAYHLPREFGFELTVLVYLYVGGVTGTLWPCMLALFGSQLGLSLEPAVFGGTSESRMWKNFGRNAIGGGVGLFLGLGINFIRNFNQAKSAGAQTLDQRRKHSPSPEG